MGDESRPPYVAVSVFAAIWMAFWSWAFSLAYSDSFFAYNQHSRLPVFAASLLGAGGIFASVVAQWRARRSLGIACLRHALGVAVSLCPLLAVSALLWRAAAPWRPSADDAMGTGIDFLLLTGVGIATVAALAGGLTVRSLWHRRMGAAPNGTQSRE